MVKDFSISYSDRVYSSLLYFCAVHRIPFGIMKQYLDIHGTDDVEGAVRSYRRGVMKSGTIKNKIVSFILCLNKVLTKLRLYGIINV